MSEKKGRFGTFGQAARDLACDEDEARFDERVRKLVKHGPAPEKGE